MKDLKFTYTAKSGERITQEYDLITDFTDSVESGEFDLKSFDGHDIYAELFENPLNHKYVDTIEELYSHLISIMS